MSNHLDLRELLGGDVSRLRYVKRWSTCRVINNESVAEHVAYVVLYCAMICTWVWDNTEVEVNEGKLLFRAAIHDIEETRTGDFPRTFKHSSPEFKAAVEKASAGHVRGLFSALMTDESSVQAYVDSWEHAKDTTPEGCILEFADFLSALSFLIEERKMGNTTITQHTGALNNYLQRFTTERYNFLRPLVNQAGAIVREAML